MFRNSCLSQSGVIVDEKVSDRQRRCCAPCRNIIGCKSIYLPCTSWFLPSVLLGAIPGEYLSLSDNDSVLFGTCNQVKLSIYVSIVFSQSGFRLHSRSRLGEIVIYCCVIHDVMVQKASFRICPTH